MAKRCYCEDDVKLIGEVDCSVLCSYYGEGLKLQYG